MIFKMRQGLSLSGCDERSRALPNGAKKKLSLVVLTR